MVIFAFGIRDPFYRSTPMVSTGTSRGNACCGLVQRADQRNGTRL